MKIVFKNVKRSRSRSKKDKSKINLSILDSYSSYFPKLSDYNIPIIIFSKKTYSFVINLNYYFVL